MSGVSVTDGHRRLAPRWGLAQETFSAAAERPKGLYVRAGLMGGRSSTKYGYLMGHGLKVMNGGRKVKKRSARIHLRAVGSFGISDLTSMSCWSSGRIGSSSASLVDLVPGSGVYWGPVYSGIFVNKSRYECLSNEKRLTWYGWGTWIVAYRWKNLVTCCAYLSLELWMSIERASRFYSEVELSGGPIN